MLRHIFNYVGYKAESHVTPIEVNSKVFITNQYHVVCLYTATLGKINKSSC